MQEIENFLKNMGCRRLTVAVIGDCVLDEYFHVIANRISPEFPIPVTRSATAIPDIVLPGGASNTCSQFRYFDVGVSLYALVDRELKTSLDAHKIDHTCSETMPAGGHVPIKKRLYQGDFPLCRWDIESKNYGLSDDQIARARQRLFNKYKNSPKPDVTIFSDYNKGLFSPQQQWIRNSGKSLTIVDPKNEPLEQWIGCTVFKPNVNEAVSLSGGLTRWQDQCNYFHDALSCPYVVITQGGDGVVGKMEGQFFEYRPKRSIEPESVIGAGDCFIAFLAMAIGSGMTPREAVTVAWEAGCLYVQRKHNRPVSRLDLRRAIDPVGSKIVTARDLKGRDFKITLTNGCFDLLHGGHVGLLNHCKSLGNKVVVAVNSDSSVSSLKGPERPIRNLHERMTMLANLSCVDFIVPFESLDPGDLIAELKPEILVKGSDYKKEDVIGGDNAGEVVIFPTIAGLSTTSIVERISCLNTQKPV